MKAKKVFAALAALAFAAGSLAFAQVRSAEEFDAEAREYKEYWLRSTQANKDKANGVLNYMIDLRKFIYEHPGSLLTYTDLVEICFKTNSVKEAVSQYKKAKEIAAAVPDSEEGKFAKAKFYRLSSEINIYVFWPKVQDNSLLMLNYEASAKSDAALCAQYDKALGTQAYYNLANFYYSLKKYAECSRMYFKAFEVDGELSLLTEKDFFTFKSACENLRKFNDLAKFYNIYIESPKTAYILDLGALAMYPYEKSSQKAKAALVGILDREYVRTYKDSDESEFVALLERRFGSDKAAKSCIAFIKKFYDKDALLAQADLDSLPEGLRSFMPVRYMFDMKNSSDIKDLRKKYENFFKPIGNFYIRLYEKAQAAGDKKTMDEMKKILSADEYNKDGKNRLNK